MNEYPSNPMNDFMEPPEELQKEEMKEQAQILSSIPVIQDVIDWMEAVAYDYSTVDTLNITSHTDEKKALATILLAKEVRAVFIDKLGEFKTQFGDYLKPQ